MITEHNGVRVDTSATASKQSRAGQAKRPRENTFQRTNKRQNKQFMWCATSRDEFNVQQTGVVRQQDSQRQFERGEGGGVT